MSAKLRSLIDYLKAPLRLWRRGRRLPARVQVTVLVAGLVSLAFALTVWTVARARPQDSGGGATESVYDQVHRLRTVDKDYAAAQALAAQFLAAHTDTDIERQQVYFEYGLTLFDAQNWPAASAAFQALVAEYANTTLDRTAADFVVDDAAYYGAVTEHYHGDKALGIARYEAFLQSFPESNRWPKALLMLAGAHEQTGDLPGALPVFEQLVREFPDSEYAPEAQIHVGHILLGMKDYAGAAAAFEEIAQRWPDSKHVPTAIQFANRALIHQELSDWDLRNGAAATRTVDNSAAIESNVDALVSTHTDDPLVPGILLDLLNYQASRCALGSLPRAEADQHTVRIVEQMLALAPEARPTIRAKLDLATAVHGTNPGRAWTLVNEAATWAASQQDESLLNDAQFTTGRLLSQEGEWPAARAAWQELLSREQSPQFESEAKLVIALTYLRAGDPVACKAALDEIIAPENYPADVRACALVCQAQAHKDQNHFAEACAALDAAIALQPGTRTAASAARLRDIYERHQLP
jgi:TolA-binding protein